MVRAALCATLGLAVFAVHSAVPGRAGGARAAPAVPGSLPDGFRYTYADAYHGWPVAPVHSEHPVRGGFLAPRVVGPIAASLHAGYHFGVDIAVDDATPDAGAPVHRSHRVYAVEGGVVTGVRDTATICDDRRLTVGHFSYWHVDPTVPAGRRVRAGAPIGWTCKGAWHVHLSEWALYKGKRVWVNPLHRGGKLAPYVDTAPPVIDEMWFTAADGETLSPDALSGRVELLAQVHDPQSFLGWLAADPQLVVPDPPYSLKVMIRDAAGRVVLSRVSFRSDRLPSTPFDVHYAPGTGMDMSVQTCLRLRCQQSSRAYVFRPLSRNRRELWDTRAVAPGRYTVTLDAWDERGNVGASTIAVEVLD